MVVENVVSLSQLQQNTTYFVKVIEYNCDPETLFKLRES